MVVFQALRGLYDTRHVHLPQWVSIATEGLTLGSAVRRKMFQLKMYMAVSGRAPERGVPGTQKAALGPRLSRKSVFGLYLTTLNERLAPVLLPLCHL